MTAIELSIPYNISCAGNMAAFNQPTDSNFVGYIDDVTGLDSYGIRENAQVIAAGDGGYHGPFWRDRRPFTVAGFIFPTMPVTARSAAQDKILSVLGNALRQDGTMVWTPSDGIQRGVYFRTQQPTRFTTGQSKVQRNFALALVSRDWRIRKWAQSSLSVAYSSGFPISVAPNNGGNADAAPIITVTGPITQPVITNTTTGKVISLNTGSSVPAGDTLVIDLTGVFPVVTLNGADVSYAVAPLTTDWSFAVAAGANTIQLNGSGGTTATSLTVAWNDSWH